MSKASNMFAGRKETTSTSSIQIFKVMDFFGDGFSKDLEGNPTKFGYKIMLQNEDGAVWDNFVIFSDQQGSLIQEDNYLHFIERLISLLRMNGLNTNYSAYASDIERAEALLVECQKLVGGIIMTQVKTGSYLGKPTSNINCYLEPSFESASNFDNIEAVKAIEAKKTEAEKVIAMSSFWGGDSIPSMPSMPSMPPVMTFAPSPSVIDEEDESI